LLSWSAGNDQGSRTIKVASIHLNEKSDMTLANPGLWPPEGTDLLVLPEYSGILKYKNYKQMLHRLSKDGIAITSIDNGRSPAGTNRIIVLNRDGYVISSEDKTFLIPTGEYMPYVLQLGFRLIGKSQALVDFRYSQQLTKGSHAETPIMTNNGLSVGALACSGVGSLNGYRSLSRDGADILTNSASLAFLLPNSIYHTYARNMARFQAVSNNKAFIQASRSGQSYIIDNQGSFVARSYNQQDQLLTANVRLYY
jgi:apolipoprotein N-acyltransferase